MAPNDADEESSTTILLNSILADPKARRPFEVSKLAIIARLGDGADEVRMDTLQISLVDPVARTRIRLPCRAADCAHMQCFDLHNYLAMCARNPNWQKCPVPACDCSAVPSELIIDDYFEQVLRSVGPSVKMVELLGDGTWRVPTTEQENAASVVTLDDSNSGLGKGNISGTVMLDSDVEALNNTTVNFDTTVSHAYETTVNVSQESDNNVSQESGSNLSRNSDSTVSRNSDSTVSQEDSNSTVSRDSDTTVSQDSSSVSYGSDSTVSHDHDTSG